MKKIIPINSLQHVIIAINVFMGFLSVISMMGCQESNNKLNLPDPLEAGWKGQLVCEVVENNDHLRVLKCLFPPGVGHERHYHNPHVGYTLKGGLFQITDSSGTRTVDVPTGSSFSKDYVSVHEVINVGETTAEFLIIEYKK